MLRIEFSCIFLSISASNEELYTSISNAIRATKSTKYEDLDVKSFLKAIKVPSLKKLYQDYTTCLIMDTGTEIKIERYILMVNIENLMELRRMTNHFYLRTN